MLEDDHSKEYLWVSGYVHHRLKRDHPGHKMILYDF